MSQNSPSTDTNNKDNNNSNKMVSPFGVVLKSTGGPRKSTALVKTVDNDKDNNHNLDSSTQSANGGGSSTIDWSQRRQSLRRVEPPPATVSSSKTRGAALAARHDPETKNPRQKLRRVPSEEKRRKPPPKRDSREIKAPWSVPFTLSSSPTFGVVLRKVPRSTQKNNNDSNSKLEQVDLKKTTPAVVKKESSPEDEDDQFLDLDFRHKGSADDATEATASTAEEDSTAANDSRGAQPFNIDTSSISSNLGAPFGVRLKPTRRRSGANFTKKSVARTYQIDLKPTIRKMTGDNTYESSSRAFLEIELKPVLQKLDKDGNAQGPQMVEMHLRHIVSPEDGGPKRTVTTASLTIPMLHHIDLNATEQERLLRQQQERSALEELLQMTISSLKHVPPREPHEYPEPQLLEIHLHHIHPTTKEMQPFGHSIQIELKPPREKDDPQPRGALPPSMLVSLKHVEPPPERKQLTEQAASPEFLNVKLNSVKVAEEEFSEPAYDEEELYDLYAEEEVSDDYDEEEIDDAKKNQPDEYDEEEIEDGKKKQQPPDEYDEEVLDDDEKKKRQLTEEIVEEEIIEDVEEIVEEYEIEDLVEKHAEKPRNLRSSMPNLVLEDMPASTTETTQPKEQDNHQKEKAAAEQDTDDRGRKARSTRRAPPQRQRSSSLSDMDRARIRDAVNKADERKFAKEEAARKLSKKKQRDLLMWYNRMKTPTREEMKRRVAKLPESCDITPEDVDALPWLCRGRFLDLKVMNQLFLEDWQGVKKDDDDSDSD